MSEIGVPHHAGNQAQKRIGIIIAVIAVAMAIVGALANKEANQKIVKEVQASNGFAWYQAKRQRSYLNELELKRIEVELVGTPSEAQKALLLAQQSKLKTKNAEYERENDDIRRGAEADRAAAELASHRHHWFEYSEILLHIAVVLCSLTLLTELRVFVQLGVGATAVGVGLALLALSVRPHAEPASPNPAAATSAPAGTQSAPARH